MLHVTRYIINIRYVPNLFQQVSCNIDTTNSTFPCFNLDYLYHRRESLIRSITMFNCKPIYTFLDKSQNFYLLKTTLIEQDRLYTGSVCKTIKCLRPIFESSSLIEVESTLNYLYVKLFSLLHP